MRGQSRAGKKVNDIRLKSVLGRGGSAVVYEANITEHKNGDFTERALVKIFEDSSLDSRVCEATALAELAKADVKNVPRLVCKGLGTSYYHNSKEPIENALVIKPVASPVLPVADSKLVRGKHLSQLIEVLKQAHEAGLQHQDVKPENVFLDNDNVNLNDWGSSCPLKINSPWEGTLGFCDPPDFEAEGKVRDLRSAVRTAWCLTRNQFPSHEESFWDFFESGDESVWQKAWEFANQTEHSKLAALLRTAV